MTGKPINDLGTCNRELLCVSHDHPKYHLHLVYNTCQSASRSCWSSCYRKKQGQICQGMTNQKLCTKKGIKFRQRTSANVNIFTKHIEFYHIFTEPIEFYRTVSLELGEGPGPPRALWGRQHWQAGKLNVSATARVISRE